MQRQKHQPMLQYECLPFGDYRLWLLHIPRFRRVDPKCGWQHTPFCTLCILMCLARGLPWSALFRSDPYSKATAIRVNSDNFGYLDDSVDCLDQRRLLTRRQMAVAWLLHILLKPGAAASTKTVWSVLVCLVKWSAASGPHRASCWRQCEWCDKFVCKRIVVARTWRPAERLVRSHSQISNSKQNIGLR